MSKRKLKLESWGQGTTDRGHYITLYFNRVLNYLEQEGIVAVVKERLNDGE